MATSYNLTDLDNRLKSYLDVHREDLITKSLFNSHASDRFTLMSGVANPTAMIAVSFDTPLKSGDSCTWEAEGQTTITDRIITPSAITCQIEYCPKDLVGSFASRQFLVDAKRESIPYEEFFLEKLAENISNEIENLIFSGNTSNSDPDPIDGILTQIENDITDSVIPAGNVIAKGTDSIFERCQKLWAACDPATMKTAEIWMSISNFKLLQLELNNSNNVSLFVTDTADFTMTLPGTSTVVRGLSSIPDTADVILMADPLNFVKSVDYVNDSEQFKFWLSDNTVFKFEFWAYVGVGYMKPENIYVNE